MHTVLLVDDEIFARQGLKSLIDWSACGFEITGEADNGEDALKLIRKSKPSLVVTDIRMPVLDGLELIRRTVEQEQHQPSFIIISGYDDFKYAQQAVRFGVHDFILKPIDELVLQETLNRLNQKLTQEKTERLQRERLKKSELFTALLKGELNDADELAECRRVLGIPTRGKLFYTLVEVNDLHPWRQGASDWSQPRYESALRGVLARIHHNLAEVYLHEHRNRTGFIAAADHIPYGGDIDIFISSIQKQLSRELQYPVYVYAGAVVDSVKEAGEAYRTAKEALQYKYANGEEMTVNYARIAHLPLRFEDLDSALCERLCEHVEERDEKAIVCDIDAIFNEFDHKGYAPEAIKLAVHKCVTGIMGIVRRMGIGDPSVASLEPIIGWHDYNLSLGEIKRLLLEFALESSRLLNRQRKEMMKTNIGKIKAYIEAHYMENISLKSIAARFYIHPVYLGQLFKKNYGCYFNEYLLRLRVGEAKKLLRQTDLRIYEIAERVGFRNADYFVTQFEKIERMTPSEYRNKLLDPEAKGEEKEKEENQQ